jgi:hypothetical protein
MILPLLRVSGFLFDALFLSRYNRMTYEASILTQVMVFMVVAGRLRSDIRLLYSN